MASSTKPTVNCVFFPMAGLKGEDAAASQMSTSGLDMFLGVQLGGIKCLLREAALVAFGPH